MCRFIPALSVPRSPRVHWGTFRLSPARPVGMGIVSPYSPHRAGRIAGSVQSLVRGLSDLAAWLEARQLS